MNERKTIALMSVNWSDPAGDYEYKLAKFIEYPDGGREALNSVFGDLEWAKRIANYYNIKVPEVKE
jgi:hypothetical protein